jgi:hypothetical protein
MLGLFSLRRLMLNTRLLRRSLVLGGESDGSSFSIKSRCESCKRRERIPAREALAVTKCAEHG